MLRLVRRPTRSIAPAARRPGDPGVEVWRDPAGRPAAWGGEEGGRFWLEVAGVGLFRFGANGARVEARAAGAEGAGRIADAFRRTVLPLALQARGAELLHASAVEAARGVVAICGSAEAGKSTLAFGLTRRGYPAWADDAVALEIGGSRVRTRRLPFALRLRPDAAAHFGCRPGRRERIVAGAPRSGRESAPLVAVVALEIGGSPAAQSERLSPPAAVAALLSHAYCFSLRDADRNRRLLEGYFEVAARVPVYRLRRGDGLDCLEAPLDRLERLAGPA